MHLSISLIQPQSFPLQKLVSEQNGFLAYPTEILICRNRFHSDKICDISYANIQGKECLIEKFRNSCVMDEDPSYRPKIFHSSGPLMGQEQELLFTIKFLMIVFLNQIIRGGNCVLSLVLVKLV